MSKSSNSLDVYFHMANHYRKLSNTKARVNSGCKKKTKEIDETDMKQNKKGNLNMESSGKVIQRNGRPKTRRNLSDMPHQMISKSRAHSNKSNVSKDRTSSIARKSRGKSARSGSQSSRNSSNSSNHAAGDTRNTSPERSTTHGVESIIKDSVTEHEYLQFALRITEDIIKNDLYNCIEMKRVFNSHIEANRGRLEMNKMKEQVRTLAKELNVKFDESEIYTLGPLDSCKNYSIPNQTDHTRCELIYVAKDMKDFDESKSAHINCNENQCVKCDSTKENQPLQYEKNCEKCCKSMNTIPENKNNCDACTNTKVVVLKNTLISGDPILPYSGEDSAVQVKSEILKIIDKKSQACCKSLEKIWVIDVATSMSCQEAVPKIPVNISKIQDSDSSINSAEMLLESLKNEETQPTMLTTKQVQENLPKHNLDFKEPVQTDYKQYMESAEDMVSKDLKSKRTFSTAVRNVFYDKPLEVKQEYFITTASHFSNPTNAEYDDEPVPQTTVKRHCTCGCCKKSEQPATNKITIWDEIDVDDVYKCPNGEEKKSIKKNDPQTKPDEYFPTLLPIVPKLIEDNDQGLFENIQPEKEKKQCSCGKAKCSLYCKSDEYAIYLPEMLAKFFPSIATQTTPSDLLLISVKSNTKEHKDEKLENSYIEVEKSEEGGEKLEIEKNNENKSLEKETVSNLISQSCDSIYIPDKTNLFLSELSPLNSTSNIEKDTKTSITEEINIETVSVDKKVKGKVRTSIVTEDQNPVRKSDSASGDLSFSEMVRSASGTLGTTEATLKDEVRKQSAEYERRKSSFAVTKVPSTEHDDEDEDKQEEIPIIFPDREEQLAFKKEQNSRDKDLEHSDSDTYEIEMKSDVKSVIDGELGSDIEGFMNQLDYKPTVAKTNSFDNRIKKTINDGEMFRHPENRRIGFESHSGIDLNRTTIAEEDHQKTIENENLKEEEESKEIEVVNDTDKEHEKTK